MNWCGHLILPAALSMVFIVVVMVMMVAMVVVSVDKAGTKINSDDCKRE